MIYYVNKDSDFLIHHRIKGQKWGVENGPPYPLNPQKDYSKSEQKAIAKDVRKRYRHSNSKKEYDDEYIDDQKEIAKAIKLLENEKNSYYDDLLNYRKARYDFLYNGAKDSNSREKLFEAINKAKASEKLYEQHCQDITNNLVGKYGNNKLTSIRFRKSKLPNGERRNPIVIKQETIGNLVNDTIKGHNGMGDDLYTTYYQLHNDNWINDDRL